MTKKRILISTEQKDAQVGSFFRELGLILDTDFDKKYSADYLFAVDNVAEELTNFPRIRTQKDLVIQNEKNIRAFVDQDFLDNAEVKKLLASYFSEVQDFDLVDRFSKDFKNVYTLKIHDYLNIGYFIDSIVVEAYKNKFDYDQIRSYLDRAIRYSLKLVEQDESPLPLEVSFSYSDAGFVVQVAATSEQFDLKKDFHSKSEILIECSKTSNYFDVCHFQKRQRVILSSLWFKEKALQNFHSYFFTEVASRQVVAEAPKELVNHLDQPEENVQYQSQAANDRSKKLHLARKFSLFIRNYRTSEESPCDLQTMTTSDVDQYLSHYPRPDAVLTVDDEIKKFIIQLLKDEKLYEGVSEYIQKIASSNLDSHVEEIQRILGEKSLEDIAEVIRLKGGNENSGDDKTVVKGWSEDQDNSAWEVKRSELVEQIKEEVTIIKSQGRNVVEDDIIRVVSKELNANPEDVKTVVKGLVEEAVSAELSQKQKLEEAFAAKFLADQSAAAQSAAREKMETQITRMKKVMEQMKAEIVKLRSDAEVRSKESIIATDGEPSSEVIELKNALTKSVEAIRNKEKLLVKSKSDFEQILAAKEVKSQALEARIEQMKEEFARSREFANEEKLEQLQAENKTLVSRLDLANRKVNIISDNMSKQENEAANKQEKEILSLKTNMQMAQGLIEKFKQERNELDQNLQLEKEKNIKLRDEKGISANPTKDQQESAAATVALQAEKKLAEDRFKLQSIELKKLEQKLKFTVAQLDESNKRKAQPPVGGKSNEAYIKQLEVANGRLTEMAADIAEKKKEAIKLKQENALLSSKLAELEKKLGNAEKKAA